MEIVNHRLTEAIWVPSPNFDTRPPEVPIRLLVIHNISLPPGEFGGENIDAFFTNNLDPQAHPYFSEIADMHVSAHCCIFRDGVVKQYVNFDQKAWHAGQSCFQGVENCNDFSIGIEMEGADEVPYSNIQYSQLNRIITILIKEYPAFSRERIVGHSDIAPGRKTDPGTAFDWSRIR